MTALVGTSIACAAARKRGRELVSDCPCVFRSASQGKETIAQQLERGGWKAARVRGGQVWRCPIHVKHAPDGPLLEALARAADPADAQPAFSGFEAPNTDDHRVAPAGGKPGRSS